MNYCGNCGQKTSKKICPHCGNNARKANRFCKWCGNEVDPNAVVCPNCHEKQKEGFGAKLAKLLSVALAVIFVILAVAFIQEGGAVSAVCFVVAAILLLPAVKSAIKKATFGKKGVRTLLTFGRSVAIVVAIIAAFSLLPESEPAANKVYKDVATEAALQVFHNEVNLKNESSFVLNDSKVTYVDNYNDNPNLALVTVVLDYSAQNGFGGMNRDTYTVKLIYTYSSNSYRPAN